MLNNGDFCRALSSIAVGTKDGNSFVRVRGEPEEHCQGRQCLHINTLDMFYEWNGKMLTPALNATY